MKKKMLLLLTAIFAFVLIACGKSDSKEQGKQEDTKSGEEIVIKHAFGETVIDKKPERVATIAWGNHDVPLSLGVVPVGMSKANYGVTPDKGILPWTEEAVTKLKGEANLFDDIDGLNFEAIAESKPDVILAAYSGITKEDYEMLSKIAPTVAYPENAWQTLWRDMVKMDGQAMGMAKEADQLIADTEKKIDEALKAHPEIAGKKVLFTMISPADLSAFWVYTEKDPRAAYLLDLGLVFPDSLAKIADPETFAVEVSAEKADQINDADVIVTYGDDKTLAALQADPVFGQLPAVKNGAVAVIPDNTPLAASCTPTPLSIEYTIDDYLDIIGAACKNVK